MIKECFIEKVKKGLGSAYLELRDTEVITEYIETLSYICLNNCTNNYLVEGSKGRYIYNLLTLFDDSNYFRDLIINKLLQEQDIEISLFTQLLDILFYFYLDKDDSIKDFILEYYNDFIIDINILNKRVNSFEYLLIVISQMSNLKTLYRLLDDINSLNINKINLSWFIHIIQLKYKTNEKIQSFYNEKIDCMDLNFNYTLEEFLSLSKEEEKIYTFSYNASITELEKLFRYLEDCREKNILLRILRQFQNHGLKQYIPMEILLNLIDVIDEDINFEIYNLLSYYKNSKITDLALTLLNNKRNLINVLQMLMTNYNRSFNDIIIELYNSVDFEKNIFSTLENFTIELMDSKNKYLPNDILLLCYRKSYDVFSREYIVNCIKKRGLLTREFCEELLYDSNSEISTRANRWLKTYKIN